MFVYVNDMLHLAKDTQEDILKLNQVYRLKEGLGHQIYILVPTPIKFNYRMEELFVP